MDASCGVSCARRLRQSLTSWLGRSLHAKDVSGGTVSEPGVYEDRWKCNLSETQVSALQRHQATSRNPMFREAPSVLGVSNAKETSLFISEGKRSFRSAEPPTQLGYVAVEAILERINTGLATFIEAATSFSSCARRCTPSCLRIYFLDLTQNNCVPLV